MEDQEELRAKYIQMSQQAPDELRAEYLELWR